MNEPAAPKQSLGVPQLSAAAGSTRARTAARTAAARASVRSGRFISAALRSPVPIRARRPGHEQGNDGDRHQDVDGQPGKGPVVLGGEQVPHRLDHQQRDGEASQDRYPGDQAPPGVQAGRDDAGGQQPQDDELAEQQGRHHDRLDETGQHQRDRGRRDPRAGQGRDTIGPGRDRLGSRFGQPTFRALQAPTKRRAPPDARDRADPSQGGQHGRPHHPPAPLLERSHRGRVHPQVLPGVERTNEDCRGFGPQPDTDEYQDQGEQAGDDERGGLREAGRPRQVGQQPTDQLGQQHDQGGQDQVAGQHGQPDPQDPGEQALLKEALLEEPAFHAPGSLPEQEVAEREAADEHEAEVGGQVAEQRPDEDQGPGTR